MNNRQRVTVNVTNRTIVRTILWIAAAIAAYKFVGRVGHILTLIFIAFFLALVFNPIVGFLSRRLKLRRRLPATAGAYILIIVVIAAFLALIVPPLVTQTRNFINTVPQTIQNFEHQDSRLSRLARKYNVDQKLSKAAQKFASQYSNYGGTLLNTGKRLVEAVASIVAVLVMAFMMLVEGPRWLELFWGVMPPAHRGRYKHMAYRMYKGVSGYAIGQVVLALIAGFFAFIALEIAGHLTHSSINSVALAGIVAVFGLIPLFGNPTAAIIVILVSLINSLTLGIVMLIYFVIYFFIENHTFQPYIQSRLNELSALTVFVAAILGVGFAGFLGAIIAIPVATAIKILVEDYFERRKQRPAPV